MKKRVLTLVSLVLMLTLLLGLTSVTAFAEEKTLNYVVLGDSIAAGTGLTNADVQSYGALIAKTNGYNYQNHAVAGHTTDNLLARLSEEEVADAVKNADIISISIGGNNFLLNGLVEMVADALIKNDYSRMDEIIDGFYVSFDKCILKIKELNPDVTLLVQTLYNPMPGSIGEAYAEGQTRLNNAYKTYLEEHPGAYTLVDITPLFAGHQDYIATDYIHPNADGHAVIAGAYLKTLAQLGLGENTEPVTPTVKEILTFDILDVIRDMIFSVTNAIKLMFSGLFA